MSLLRDLLMLTVKMNLIGSLKHYTREVEGQLKNEMQLLNLALVVAWFSQYKAEIRGSPPHAIYNQF